MPERETLSRFLATPQKILALRLADHIEVTLKNLSKSTVTCYTIVNKELPPENNNLKKYVFTVPSTVELVKYNEFFPERIMDQTFTATALLTWSRYNWELQTAFGLIEEGDELEFVWLVDAGDTPSLPNIFTDALKLILYRAEFRLHFRITTVVARNKRNRMIRNAKKSWSSV